MFRYCKTEKKKNLRENRYNCSKQRWPGSVQSAVVEKLRWGAWRGDCSRSHDRRRRFPFTVKIGHERNASRRRVEIVDTTAVMVFRPPVYRPCVPTSRRECPDMWRGGFNVITYPTVGCSAAEGRGTAIAIAAIGCIPATRRPD